MRGAVRTMRAAGRTPLHPLSAPSPNRHVEVGRDRWPDPSKGRDYAIVLRSGPLLVALVADMIVYSGPHGCADESNLVECRQCCCRYAWSKGIHVAESNNDALLQSEQTKAGWLRCNRTHIVGNWSRHELHASNTTHPKRALARATSPLMVCSSRAR